jgi:hypothetical protein
MGEIVLLVIEAGIQVINALFGWIPGVTEATAEVAKGAEKTIRDNFGAKKAAEDKGKEFSENLKGTKSGAEKAGAEIGKYAKAGADSADIKSIGSVKGTDFAAALANKSGAASTSGKEIANSGKTGAGSVSMTSTGTNFGTSFANGMDSDSVMSRVASAARRIANAASAKVQSWLQIGSPSRVAERFGNFFGDGLAIGIEDRIDSVGSSAKDLALKAKATLDKFLDILTPDDNELHFKAVVDYDALDTKKFGRMDPIGLRPDTSFTNRLVSAAKSNFGQNGNNTPSNVNNTATTNNYEIKVEAKGVSSRSEIRRLAEQLQTEMKNLNDRGKISRGEGVAF